MIIASLVFFFVTSTLHVIAVALKTQWFRYLPGWILAGYIAGFFSVGVYLLGRWLGWIPMSWQLPLYIVVFGGFGLINLTSTVVLLNRNWNYWAWTKGDR